MQTLPLRLVPGDDLRASLEAIARSQALSAAFVLQGIGSLSVARLRYAGIDDPAQLTGDFEILTFAGSLSIDGAHLHMSISDRDGRVFGGHVATGCIVRTTAEILHRAAPGAHVLARIRSATGFPELVVRPR